MEFHLGLTQGCLLGLKCIVENLNDEFMLNKTTELRGSAQNLLTHDEVRVRLAAGMKSVFFKLEIIRFHGVKTSHAARLRLYLVGLYVKRFVTGIVWGGKLWC